MMETREDGVIIMIIIIRRLAMNEEQMNVQPHTRNNNSNGHTNPPTFPPTPTIGQGWKPEEEKPPHTLEATAADVPEEKPLPCSTAWISASVMLAGGETLPGKERERA